MPPALSDDEASDYESPLPMKPSRGSVLSDEVNVPLKSVKLSDGSDIDVVIDQGEDEEEEHEEDEEELEEDEFVVEKILRHMVDEDGTIKCQVKWEGYDDKADLTWEPENNLEETAGEILSAYFDSIGGRDRIFEELQTASRGKKRGRTSSSTPAAMQKRSRKNGAHPGDSTPPATSQAWSPPAGSWEDLIKSIDACEEGGSGKLIVFLVWKNGQKTKHDTKVVYKKCPQMMLKFYESHVRIVKEESKAEYE